MPTQKQTGQRVRLTAGSFADCSYTGCTVDFEPSAAIDLRQCEFHDCVMGGQQLGGTWRDVKLTNCAVKMTSLKRVNLEAVWWEGCDTRRLAVIDCSWSGGGVRATNLTATCWIDCSLRDIEIAVCDATGLAAPGGRFERITGNGGRWQAADFSNTRFEGCGLVQADFSASCMRGAVFHACDLRDAICEFCDMSGASLAASHCSGARFTGSDLTCASITDSDLANADFYWCDLSSTSIQRSKLTGARMPVLVREAYAPSEASPAPVKPRMSRQPLSETDLQKFTR